MKRPINPYLRGTLGQVIVGDDDEDEDDVGQDGGAHWTEIIGNLPSGLGQVKAIVLGENKPTKADEEAAWQIMRGAVIGSLAGALGGALLWKKHRVAGGLLGFFVVGPLVGGGVATAIVRSSSGAPGKKK